MDLNLTQRTIIERLDPKPCAPNSIATSRAYYTARNIFLHQPIFRLVGTKYGLCLVLMLGPALIEQRPISDCPEADRSRGGGGGGGGGGQWGL